jgi:hypothetical protein
MGGIEEVENMIAEHLGRHSAWNPTLWNAVAGRPSGLACVVASDATTATSSGMGSAAHAYLFGLLFLDASIPSLWSQARHVDFGRFAEVADVEDALVARTLATGIALPWFLATDGDPSTGARHRDAITALMEHTVSGASLWDLAGWVYENWLFPNGKFGRSWPISDFLRLLKNQRQRVMNHDVAVADGDDVVVFGAELFQEHGMRGFDDTRHQTAMQDGPALEAFQLRNVLDLLSAGEFEASRYIAPWALLDVAIRPHVLRRTARLEVLDAAFAQFRWMLDNPLPADEATQRYSPKLELPVTAAVRSVLVRTFPGPGCVINKWKRLICFGRMLISNLAGIIRQNVTIFI